MDIGVIAYGTVGKALCMGFADKARLHVFDPQYNARKAPHFRDSIEQVWHACEFIFIAVPTPQKPQTQRQGGPFDAVHLDTCMATLAQQQAANKIVVITSTTLPSKISDYRRRYPELKLVVMPEFLTEKNAERDFLHPAFRIIGGDAEHTHKVQQLLDRYSTCAPCKIGHCDAISAAFIKYMINSYLALKLSFLNQFYDLFQHSGAAIPWQELTELLHYDLRMGTSHKNVPGPDGERGWGGKCLPKDVNAILHDAEAQGHSLSLLKEAWQYNLGIRTKIDWV